MTRLVLAATLVLAILALVITRTSFPPRTTGPGDQAPGRCVITIWTTFNC